GKLDQLGARLHHRLMSDRGAIDELEIESGCVAQLEHRRWRVRGDLCSMDGREGLVGPGYDGGDGVVTFAALGAPALQTDESQSGALPVTAEAETADRKNGANPALLHIVGAHLIEHFFRKLDRSPGWRGDLREQDA